MPKLLIIRIAHFIWRIPTIESHFLFWSIYSTVGTIYNSNMVRMSGKYWKIKFVIVRQRLIKSSITHLDAAQGLKLHSYVCCDVFFLEFSHAIIIKAIFYMRSYTTR